MFLIEVGNGILKLFRLIIFYRELAKTLGALNP